MGLRMSAAWGCVGAQHGAAHERSMGLRMSAAWGCAWGVPRGVHGGGGGRLTTGCWRPPLTPRPSPGGYWCLGCKRDSWPHHRLLASRCKVGVGRLATS